MFAAELARSLGRFDWWNIRDEHTPFEWIVQRAMYAATPWGERRADFRAAIHTANLLMQQAARESQTADNFQEIVRSLADYAEAGEEGADLQALELMRQTNG